MYKLIIFILVLFVNFLSAQELPVKVKSPPEEAPPPRPIWKVVPSPEFFYVEVNGQEGVLKNWKPTDKTMSFLERFERTLKKEKRAYNDYYRVYVITSNDLERLTVDLVPKCLISEERRREHRYSITGVPVFSVDYDGNNDHVSIVRTSVILPDL